MTDATPTKDTPTMPEKRLSPAFAPDQPPSLHYFTKHLIPYKDQILKLPVIIFLLESFLASLLYKSHRHDAFLRFQLQQLLSVNFMLAGLAHFSTPIVKKYRKLVPDFLPNKDFWIYITGVPMCVGSVALCFENSQVWAAKLLIFTLVVVFPGNLWTLVSKDARDALGGTMAEAVIRIPFQFTMIVWCMWFLEK